MYQFIFLLSEGGLDAWEAVGLNFIVLMETTDSLRQESSWDKVKRAQSKKGQSYVSFIDINQSKPHCRLQTYGACTVLQFLCPFHRKQHFFQWSRAFKIFCFGFSGRNPTLSHLSQTQANILTLTDEISFWGAKCNILTFQEISSGQYCFSYWPKEKIAWVSHYVILFMCRLRKTLTKTVSIFHLPNNKLKMTPDGLEDYYR